MDTMRTVYGRVRETRAAFLAFLKGLPFDTITQELPDVGHGSMRGLMLHVAGCCAWWPHAFPGCLPFPDMRSIRGEFSKVDGVVESFLETYGGSLDRPETRPVPWGGKPSPRHLAGSSPTRRRTCSTTRDRSSCSPAGWVVLR